MDPNDIQPGVRIENVHESPRPGEHFMIESVSGRTIDSTVVIGMYGPNGMAPLNRTFKSVRDHYRRKG